MTLIAPVGLIDLVDVQLVRAAIRRSAALQGRFVQRLQRDKLSIALLVLR